MPERRLSVPVAALAAALPLAVGCSSNGAATGTPPPLVSTSASSLTSSPPVTPTVTPTATTAVNTDAAVLATVQKYPKALTQAGAATNLTGLYAITTTDCPCRSGEEMVVKNLRALHAHTTATFTVSHVVLQARTATQALVFVRVDNAAFKVVDSTGKVIQMDAAASDPQRLDLRLIGDRWLIESVTSHT